MDNWVLMPGSIKPIFTGVARGGFQRFRTPPPPPTSLPLDYETGYNFKQRKKNQKGFTYYIEGINVITIIKRSARQHCSANAKHGAS